MPGYKTEDKDDNTGSMLEELRRKRKKQKGSKGSSDIFTKDAVIDLSNAHSDELKAIAAAINKRV